MSPAYICVCVWFLIFDIYGLIHCFPTSITHLIFKLQQDPEYIFLLKLHINFIKNQWIWLCHFFLMLILFLQHLINEILGIGRKVSSVQSLSRVRLFATPCTAAHQVSLPITNSRNWLKIMSIQLVMPPNYLILYHPFLLPSSIFPEIRIFSKESVLHIRCPKYWSFSFSINTSNEYSGLISFRMDWLDLLAVQGTLKSLLQHHSSKASILRRSAFPIAQLSHTYITTGKTISLTRQNFIGKIMSAL